MKDNEYKITKVGAIHYIFNAEDSIELTENLIRMIIHKIDNNFKIYTNTHVIVTRFERDGNMKKYFSIMVTDITETSFKISKETLDYITICDDDGHNIALLYQRFKSKKHHSLECIEDLKTKVCSFKNSNDYFVVAKTTSKGVDEHVIFKIIIKTLYDDYNIFEDTRVICSIIDGDPLNLFKDKFEIYDITSVSDYKSKSISIFDKMYSTHSTLTSHWIGDYIKKYKSILDNIDYDVTTMKVNEYEYYKEYSDERY
jgi:hypothetical protein